MAKIGSTSLDSNDLCPELELKLVSGEILRLPEGTGDGYGVILIYRGHW